MKLLVVTLFLTTCFVGWMQATVTLANSGYPMSGANPQRNFKANKPIRCLSASNGKTTVLSPIHQFPDALSSSTISSLEITLDDKGWGYAIAYPSDTGYYIYRFNTTDGSYDPGNDIYAGFDSPKITHLTGGIFYYSGSSTTNVGNATATGTLAISSYQDGSDFTSQTSMAPFKNDWMVKARAQKDDAYPDAVLFFKDSTRTVDTTFTNIAPAFNPTYRQNVIIYKSTTDSTEFPIVYSLPPDPVIIASPTYVIPLNDNVYAKQVMVVGDEIIVVYGVIYLNPYDIRDLGLYKFNAATGAMIMNKTIDSWNGNVYSVVGSLMYHNNRAILQLFINAKSYWVDLISGETLATSDDFAPLDRDFAFSNVDQTLLSIGTSRKTNYVEVTGIEFDTWKVNVRGRFPVIARDITYGTVIIGDNCRVHAVFNKVVHTLAPLPIQRVVPILECIDRNTRIGYFSYNNMETHSFVIPQVDDRNNFIPGSFAPLQDFAVGRGPYYPLSYQILLNESDSFGWTLENYVLSFTVGADLYCPETITIVITLTADSPFPVGFSSIVRGIFVNVTGISDSRVTLVPQKRSVAQQSTLETELEIAPDPTNTEPSPAKVVQDFTQNQQDQFNQAVQSQTDAPANIQTNLAGKPLPTERQGEIPPPVAQPGSQPGSTQTTPTSVPVQPTSNASAVHLMMRFVAVAVAFITI